ncbi:hypothetical protein [Peromfec virus RodF5_8]|uniref:Uncharacterized protein n=1 Tax=Peromfec virus RodF5_8 TaxID=2929344 RepID=A0A976N3A0_9VIRU|nr:hypothetical protein [Peromfec virus RodF5_8]
MQNSTKKLAILQAFLYFYTSLKQKAMTKFEKRFEKEGCFYRDLATSEYYELKLVCTSKRVRFGLRPIKKYIFSLTSTKTHEEAPYHLSLSEAEFNGLRKLHVLVTTPSQI